MMPSVLVLLPAYRPGKIFFRVMDSLKQAIANKPVQVLVLLQDGGSGYERYARELGYATISKSFSSLPGNSYQHALRFLITEIEQGQHAGKFNPEFVMILDKDNLIEKDFFDRIPDQYYQDHHIIQGRRKSLNQENAVSLFDSLAEQLNDQLYRKAKSNLGLMVEISGSGALVRTNLFLSVIRSLDSKAPGFDKNFMVQVLCQHPEVSAVYVEDSIVWEEKTSELEAFGSQRLRWFGEQYYNAVYHAATLITAAWKQKRFAPIEYWITLCRPPRSFHLLVVMVFSLLELTIWFIRDGWMAQFPFFTTSLLFVLLAVVILLAQSPERVKIKNIFAFVRIALWNAKLAFNSMKPENFGKFIHTPHKHE